MTADVAIIIVTYNSADHIVPCLQSIYDQPTKLNQQVVIVDNDSKDDTVKIIRDRFPQVDLIEPKKNLGFAKGVNLGASESNAEFVLLLNPDTEVTDNAIDTIVAFARKHPDYGIYGGRTLTPEGKLEPSSCWGLPSLWSTFLFATGLSTLAPRNPILDPESLGGWNRDSVREVGVITGCFLLAKRKTWDELGGLDDRYFMYGEDADFAMRARRTGHRPVICPDAKVIHEVGQCSKTTTDKMFLLYKGKASLMHTHWTGLRKSLGLFSLSAGTGFRALLWAIICSVKGSEKDDRWAELWNRRNEWMKGWTS